MIGWVVVLFVFFVFLFGLEGNIATEKNWNILVSILRCLGKSKLTGIASEAGMGAFIDRRLKTGANWIRGPARPQPLLMSPDYSLARLPHLLRGGAYMIYTGATFVSAPAHPGSFSWLCIRLHDTTRKCHVPERIIYPGCCILEREFDYGTKSRSIVTSTKNGHSFGCKIGLPVACNGQLCQSKMALLRRIWDEKKTVAFLLACKRDTKTSSPALAPT